MLKKLAVACVIIMLIPGVISLYDQAQLTGYAPISHYTYEDVKVDFKHNGIVY